MGLASVLPFIGMVLIYGSVHAEDIDCGTGRLSKVELPGGLTEMQCMYDAGSNAIVQGGPYALLYENGKYSISASFKNGKPHGVWISFYRNGMRNEEGAYYEGKKIGVWQKWSETGDLISTKDYR